MSRGATRRHGGGVGADVGVGSGAGVRAGVGSGVGARGVAGEVEVGSSSEAPPAIWPGPGAAGGRPLASDGASGTGGAPLDPAPAAPITPAPGVPATPATSPRSGAADRGINANAVAPTASRIATAATAAALGPGVGVGREATGAGRAVALRSVAARSVARTDRSTDVVAVAMPQAGHAPTDRAQQRWQAWMPHALHVVRPTRCSAPSGRAGLPQRSQKRSGAPSADAAAQGSIIGRTQPSRRPRRLTRTSQSDRFGECSARTPRRIAPVAPCTRTPYRIPTRRFMPTPTPPRSRRSCLVNRQGVDRGPDQRRVFRVGRATDGKAVQGRLGSPERTEARRPDEIPGAGHRPADHQHRCLQPGQPRRERGAQHRERVVEHA
jgi:hypothetical protein